MMAVSTISYVDRHTLALLSPTILASTGMSAEDYGFVVSAFSVAYMIGNPLWGAWLDRVGVRLGMALAVLVWSCASTAHAWAGSVASFAVCRAILGFGEGATFPGGFRTAQQTLPLHLRSRGVALAYSGGSLGAMLTPLVVTPVALAFGWRRAFLFTGGLGALWLLAWMLVSRTPAVAVKPQAVGAAGDRPRFRDRRLWAFLSIYALGGVPLGFVLYGAPLYLSRALHLSQGQLGKVLFLPPLGWELGYFAWGAVADRMPRGVAERSARSARILLGLSVGATALALAPHAGSLGATLAVLVFAMVLAAGFIIVSVAYASAVFSTDHAALLAGLGAGAWSACTAVAMPGFGRLMDQGRFVEAFTLAAAAPLVGYAGFAALRPKGAATGTRVSPPSTPGTEGR